MGWDGMRLDLSFSCIVIDGVMKMECDHGNDVFSAFSLSPAFYFPILGADLNDLASASSDRRGRVEVRIAQNRDFQALPRI
jgi:hypothetical protein